MYLFDGSARRIVAPFDPGEMRRFVVWSLEATGFKGPARRTPCARFAASPCATRLGVADNLKPVGD
jgi:hypothetical protein